MIRSNVVFPDPEAPHRAKTLPTSMENDTSWRTQRCPNDLQLPLTRSGLVELPHARCTSMFGIFTSSAPNTLSRTHERHRRFECSLSCRQKSTTLLKFCATDGGAGSGKIGYYRHPMPLQV